MKYGPKERKRKQHKKEWESQQYRWKMTEGNNEVWRQKGRKKETNKQRKKGRKAKRMREQGKENEKKGRQKLKRETEERKGNETKDETEKTQSNMTWIHSHSCLRHSVFSPEPYVTVFHRKWTLCCDAVWMFMIYKSPHIVQTVKHRRI